MAEEEYVEPSNEQLAKFLIAYSKQIPETAGLQLHEPVLRDLMNRNPVFRAGALRHHRRFQEQIKEWERIIKAGEAQCEHTLQSGKQCPNRNEPGIPYCGLHKEEHEGDPSGEDAQPHS